MGPEPYIGSIGLFGGNFPPQPSYVECNGQLLPISNNAAFFSVVGDRFGGDGRNTVGVPDLRGRVPIGYGQGTGLSNHPLGLIGGAETQTLAIPNLPAHNHEATFDITELSATSVSAWSNSSIASDMKCQNSQGNQNSPVGNFPAVATSGDLAWGASPDNQLNANAIESVLQNLDLATTTTLTAGKNIVDTLDTGGNAPFSIMQPFQAINYVIATDGVYPNRT